MVAGGRQGEEGRGEEDASEAPQAPGTGGVDEPIFDSAFSDFDLTGSQQDLLTVRITPPPSVAAPPQRSGRLLRPRSHLRSKTASKRQVQSLSPPRRRRLTQDYADTELYRVGRSTTRSHGDMQQGNEPEQDPPFLPFLLRSGRREKSIFKDRYQQEEKLKKLQASHTL